MPKTKTASLDQARVDAIADRISTTFGVVLASRADADTARDASTLAAQGNVSTREGVLADLAAEAVQGAWSEAEVRVASKLAVTRRNDPDKSSVKTIGTFVSEARRVMQPTVAPHIHNFLALRDQVWEHEDTLDKSERTVRGTYSRRYHALLSGLVGALEDGTLITTVGDFVAHAAANHPSKSAAKVAARIAAIAEELAAIAVGFPCPDLEAASSHLACVTEAVLLAHSTVDTVTGVSEPSEASPFEGRASEIPLSVTPTHNHQDLQVPVVVDKSISDNSVDSWDSFLNTLELAA